MEYTLKPNNYDSKPWFLRFTTQKAKCPRRFWEASLDPEFLHTCLTCPCRAFNDYLFPLENAGFLKPQIPHTIQKPKYLAKENKKQRERSRKARQEHIKHGCKISGSPCLERRGHWTLKGIFFFYSNKPVLVSSFALCVNGYLEPRCIMQMHGPHVSRCGSMHHADAWSTRKSVWTYITVAERLPQMSAAGEVR